ncbi:carbohydrate binding domain-containing protein [Bacillus niameyensis]|uniref:carbohydrate binding domain-containing protein n=1 Tax=Bacillus niameyensis TaxID=1522308 RepID=UPI000785EFD0|nr:carbohydrate binding domain-containing protein [Bacillus niameyensis]
MREKRKKALLISYCIALILGMFTTLPSMSSAEEATERTIDIYNGGFEEPVKIPGWNPVTNHLESTLTVSSAQALSGTNSLHFNNSSAEEQLQISSEKIPLTAGQDYIAKANAYVVQQTHSLGYEIHYYNEAGEKVGAATFINFAKGTLKANEWNQLEVPFTMLESATHVQLRFNSGKIAVTEAYIDDVLIESAEREEITVPNNGFEEAVEIPGWRLVTTNTVSEVALESETVHSGTSSLHFNNSSNEEQLQVASEKITVTAGTSYEAVASVNVVKLTHSLGYEIHFFNDANEKVGNAEFKLFREADLGKNQWTEIRVPFTVPEGATRIELRFNSGKVAVTEAFIDDVALKTSGEEEEPPVTEYPTEVTNPSFEDVGEASVIPGWTVEGDLLGVKLSTDRAKEGKQSIHFHDTSDQAGLRIWSDPVAVTPKKSYLASVFVNTVSQTHNIVYEVYFYNGDGKQVGHKQELFGNLPKNTWTDLKVLAEAPANAAYARLVFYSGGISLTEAYFDEVAFELLEEEEPLEREYAQAKKLGPMVHVQLGQAGKIGENSLGENEIYYHSNGLPGTFSVLNAETGELKFSQVIPNTEAVWAMTIGPDKNVYFAGTADGKLYRYLPELKKVEELGANPSDTWIWDLEATEDGKIYGSTYPHASVFEYDIETGQFRDYGRVSDTEEYARGIAVSDESIYVGIGSKKHLYKVDRQSGEKEEIIIAGHSGEDGFFEDIHLINGKLLLSVGSINMLVVDPDDYSILNTFQYSNNVSQPNPNKPNIIYYKFQEKFYQYDFEANESKVIENLPLLPDTVRVKDMQWLTVENGDTVLAMITQYGEYMLYHPETNDMMFINLDLAATSVAIQALKTGEDGNLYMGGYQRGMSIFNPYTQDVTVNLSAFAQPEGIGFLNGKVYYGTYVGAIMYSYDPTKPVDLNNNPKFEYDITDQQDRPFAITSGDDKLFVGTVPDYGILGGVLAIYDEKTDTWTQHRNVVKDQSIIGLVYHNGKLYGGTSVWGGLGTDPKATEAKMFVWDVEKGEKIAEFTPEIPGIDKTPRMIGDLSIGPDGNLWGAVEGTIFKMDPDTYEILASKTIQPSLYNSSKWFPYRLEWGPDGMLYTTLSRKLIVIDPESLNYKVLEDQFMNNMTVGVNGSIFYALGDELFEIEVPETDATLSTIKVGGKEVNGFSPGMLSYTVSSDSVKEVEVETTQLGAEFEILDEGDKTVITVTATDKKSSLQYTIKWDDGEDPGDQEITAKKILETVESLEAEGEFNDEQSIRTLKLHLTSVSQFESKGDDVKVAKHMEAFLRLLEQLRKKGSISDRAFSELKAEAETMLKK